MALDSAKLAYAGAFVIFAGAVYRYMGARIVGILDTYSANVRKQLEEAQTLREDAQALLASYQRRQHDALKEAQEILARARMDADALRAEALAELERDLARREQAALDRIALGTSRARQEVQAAAINTVMATLETLIREQATQTSTDMLVRLAEKTPMMTNVIHAAARMEKARERKAATETLSHAS